MIDTLKQLCVNAGLVPSTCILDGYSCSDLGYETKGNPCSICDKDRKICYGKPKGENTNE